MRKLSIISSIIILGAIVMLSLAQIPQPQEVDPNNRLQAIESSEEENTSTSPTPEAKKIFLALLLDTSNSMDGLIDQAKSQLWNVVDEMANAEHGGVPAELHIGLYEYGNDNLSMMSGYVRQVSPFTEDLDEISTQLFALKTNGGSEYCGTVIKNALSNLEWSNNPEDLKMIFIAGNEPFDQGVFSFETYCRKAKEQNTIVNTIFCGDYREGINTYWEKGANLGGGSYMNIDMDQKTVYIATPYDASIDSLNDKLNSTYIGYGTQGRMRKEKQRIEDDNAQSYSTANKVKRAISKSKHVYKNDSWDLVDAVKQNKLKVEDLKTDDLPKEMKSLTIEERKAYVESKERERKDVQQEISNLAIKRKTYIKEAQKDSANNNELENAILKSVKTKAVERSFTFKEN